MTERKQKSAVSKKEAREENTKELQEDTKEL